MNIRYSLGLWVSILLVSFSGAAQEEIPQLTSRDSIVSSYWLAGLGINIVDDSWRARGNYSLSEMWHFVPYPSRVSFGRYFRSGIGLEVIGSYNKFKEGKAVDGEVITEESDYWAFDTRVSYDLNRLFGETGFFDPYVGGGLGYTETDVRRRTANAVVGFRLWFSERWGADISTSGKWGLESESTNHIQHAAGVAYRFGMKKELSRKGREKLAVQSAMLAEQQRIQDSIQASQEAEERAKQLALEEQRRKEAAAAAVLAQQQAEEAARRKGLEDELKSLGKVGYAFNSSYLDSTSRETLTKIAEFMKSNPELTFSLTGFADSRGSSEYNQWLSERRANRALDFLKELGVAEDRIAVQGLGESILLNHCKDGVRCTSAEHAVNRRAEFTITSFGD